MPITSKLSDDESIITINVGGRFDFAVQNEFRECYCNTQPDGSTRFIIDTKDTVYMDSSALGMLLMMREYLGGNNADISIINCSPDIENILTVANFQTLFKMR
jgi:anti-anti-sigma factor